MVPYMLVWISYRSNCWNYSKNRNISCPFSISPRKHRYCLKSHYHRRAEVERDLWRRGPTPCSARGGCSEPSPVRLWMSLHDAACEQRLPELEHSHRKVSLFVDCVFLLRISFFFFQLFMLTWNFLFPELPLACQTFPSMHSFLHGPASLVQWAQNWTQHSRFVLAVLSRRETSSPLVCWQPEVLPPFLARSSPCWLTFAFLATKTFCAELLCSWASLSMSQCLGLFLSRSGASHFPLLIFMSFLSANPANLSRAFWVQHSDHK